MTHAGRACRIASTPEGHLLPVQEWPDDLAAAVGGVEVTTRNRTAGDGVQEDVVKIKQWDKLKV